VATRFRPATRQPEHGCRRLEDADQVDEACEGVWVVSNFGGDLLESVANGVGVKVDLVGSFGDVEVGF
jgi:hypothetical protein